MGKFSDIYNAEKSTSKTTSKSNTTSKKTFSQMYNEERKKKEEEQKKASSVSATGTANKTATHGGSGGKSYNNNYEIQNDDWNKLTAVSKNDSTSRGAYASLSRKGYTDEYINNYSKIAGYGNLKNNADYAENSKGDNVYKEEYKNQNAYTNYTASTTGDSNLPIFSYVPDKDKTKDLNVLNDEERSNFNYLYNTKGRESAEEYYDTIINDVNKRRQKEEIAKMESDYEQMSPTAQAVVGVGGTVAGFVGQTLGNTIATAKDAYDMASSFSNNLTNYINERKQNGTDENTPFLTNAWNTFKDINGMVKDYEINPYDEYHDMKNEVSAFRNMIGNKIEQNTELEFMGQNVARKAYEIINSAADSKIGGLAFGAPYTVLMGVNAFTDRIEEGVKNGEDKEVALKKASIEGAAETLSEIISLELILKTGIGKNFVETAWNFIKLGIDEGSEEVASDLFKDFWESKVDKWYGEVPEMQQQVQTLVANGMDEKSAEKQVIKEKIRELGWSFISGAGAGLLGGTGATIANVNNVRTLGKDIREKGETENVLKTIAENTKGKVKTASQEYLAKIGRKEKLSDLNVGGLTAQAIEQLDEEYAKNKKAYDREDKSIEKAKAEQMEIDAKNKKADSENDSVKMAVSNPTISINGKSTTINGNNVVDGKYDSTKTSVFTDVGGKAIAKGSVDGKTYTAKDIADNTKDYNVKALYGYIAENNLLANQANFLVNNYDGESNVDAYVKAYDAFKKAGEIGASDGYLDVVISKTYSDYFTKEQQDNIMSASLANRPLKVGLTDYTTKAKSNSTKVQMKVVDSIAKALGKEVVLFDDLQKDLGDKIRGYNGANFGNGRIALSAQAEGGLILRSFAHEIGHSIKQSDSKAFAELREVVQATADAKGIDLKKDVQKYKDSGYDESQIYDELICDSLYNVLFDEKVLRKVLGNNISSIALSKAVKKILPIYDSTINMMIKGGKSELAMLNDNKEALRKISDIFASADKSGVKETTETEEGTFRELDDVDFSVRKNNQELKVLNSLTNGNAKVKLNQNNDLLLGTSDNGRNVFYSTNTLYNGGLDTLETVLRANGHSEEEVKRVTDQLKTADKYLHDLADKYGYKVLTDHLNANIITDVKTGRQIIFPLVSNGDYPVNIDLALICKKRVAYMKLMTRLIEDGVMRNVRFGGDAIAKANEILRDAGLETACLGCFVEARRLQFQNWAETICQEWNDAVDKLRVGAPSFDFAGGIEFDSGKMSESEITALDDYMSGVELNDKGNIKVKDDNGKTVTAVASKMYWMLKNLKDSGNTKAFNSLAKHLTVSDLLTPEGLNNLRAYDQNIFSIVKQRYGAASPKIVQEFSPYSSEIALISNSTVKQMTGKTINGLSNYLKDAEQELIREGRIAPSSKNQEENILWKADIENRALQNYFSDIGGVRMQSFSDFMIENTLDYLQLIADLEARKFTMHTYTKEISELRMFGMTGIKGNGSLIAHCDPKMGKALAGLLPYNETTKKQGIPVTYKGTKYILGFDDYERYLRTSKSTDEDTSYIQSIGYKDIISLILDKRYSKNIGSICIGVSDAQITAMLDCDYIRMIIPYHKSGMLPEFAKLVGVDLYTDYTKHQNTKLNKVKSIDGKAIALFEKKISGSKARGDEIYETQAKLIVGKKDGKDVYAGNSQVEHYDWNKKVHELGGAKEAAADYIKWCNEWHEIYNSDGELIGYATYTPKFNQFSYHKNYYKVLEDFNSYDGTTSGDNEVAAQQEAVRYILPSEEAKLSDSELAEYRDRLTKTGLYTKEEIDKYLEYANMTFEQLLDKEVKSRKEYSDYMDDVWEDVVGEVEDVLLNEKDKKGKYKFRRTAQTTSVEQFAKVQKSKQKGTVIPLDNSYLNEKYEIKKNGKGIPSSVNLSTRDSEGNELSPQQQEFFKNSKVRDEDGNLKVMYHGTSNTVAFTKFNTKDSVGVGSFFSDNVEVSSVYAGVTILSDADIYHPSKTYDIDTLSDIFEYYDYDMSVSGNRISISNGESNHIFNGEKEASDWAKENLLYYDFDNRLVYGVYLNIENPLVIDAKHGNWDMIPDFNKVKTAIEYAKLYDSADGETFTVKYSEIGKDTVVEDFDRNELEAKFGKDGALMLINGDELQDVFIDENGEELIKTTNEWTEYAYDNGYDGVIFNNIYDGGTLESTVCVAFNPNQIKDTENKNPTSDPDIRYSTRDAEYMSAVKSNDMAKAQKMVDVAAKEAGYVKELFHGTDSRNHIDVFDEWKANYFSPSKEYSEQFGDKIYRVYVKSGKVFDTEFDETSRQIYNNEFVPYSKERGWNRYGIKKLLGLGELSDFTTADDLYAFLRMRNRNNKEKYDSIRIFENGAYAVENPDADYAYIPLDNRNIKSSETVTYDDNGNIIPLSERFNNSNPDIRYSARDSLGNNLSSQQQEFFKDSKVRDEDGNLKVMYHGTSNYGFNVFDYGRRKYGMYGGGFYFTENENIGKEYTEKGRGDNPGVYQVYLNITNPMDMDKTLDIYGEDFKKWCNLINELGYDGDSIREVAREINNDLKGIDLGEAITNAYMFYQLAEQISDDETTTVDDAMEILESAIRGLGYDGMTHIGGGRHSKSDGTKHRVYIALDQEQIKNIDNKNPTSDPDIRYSTRVSNGLLAEEEGVAIYIRNTSKADYIKMIFRGRKTEETRGNKSLDKFKGKSVGVTDGEYVYGEVVLGEPRKILAKDFHKRENQRLHRVPKGDTYDVKEGKYKQSYPIISYKKYDKPKKLSGSTDYMYSYQARTVNYSARDVDGQISFLDMDDAKLQTGEQLTFDTALLDVDENTPKLPDGRRADIAGNTYTDEERKFVLLGNYYRNNKASAFYNKDNAKFWDAWRKEFDDYFPKESVNSETGEVNVRNTDKFIVTVKNTNSVGTLDWMLPTLREYYLVYSNPPHRGINGWFDNMSYLVIEDCINARKNELENKPYGTNVNVKKGEYSQDQIEKMFRVLNTSEELNDIAEKVFKLAKEFNVRYVFGKARKGNAGEAVGNRIVYDIGYFNNEQISDNSKAATLLHEAIHTVTVYAVSGRSTKSSLDAKAYRMLGENQKKASWALYELYDEAEYRSKLDNKDSYKYLELWGIKQYGIRKNQNEYVAELADIDLRYALSQEDIIGTTLDGKFKNIVFELLGYDTKDKNMLQVTEGLVNYLVDYPDQDTAIAFFKDCLDCYTNPYNARDYKRFRYFNFDEYGYKDMSNTHNAYYSARDDMSGYYSEVIRENRRLQTILASLGDAYSSIRKDTYVSKDRVRTYAQELVNKYNSTMDVNALTDRIYAVYDWIDAQRKTNKGYQVVDTEQAVMPLREIANDIMMTSTVVDTTKYDMSRPLRKYLREHTLYVTEEESREIPDFMAEKKLLGGRVRVSIGEYDNRGNKRVHLADAWNILCELSGGTEVDGGYEYVGGELNPDTNQKDMLRELFEYFQSHEKTFVTGDQAINAMFNMGMLDSTEAEADVLASEMLENHLKMISEKEPTANQKLTAFLHDLEAQTVQLRENYKNDAKKSYEEKLQAYKDKREMLDDKRVLRNKIQRDYNYVSRRWREQSAQYHITENMKGLAEKYLKSFVMANPKAQVTRFDKVAMSDLARQMRLDFKDDADIVELAQKLENFSNEYHEAKYKGYAYDTDALANISVEDLQTISNVSAFIKHRIEVENNLVGERRKEDLKVVAESVHKEYSSMADKTIANINPNDSTKARIWSMSNKINLGLTKPYYLVQNCGSSTMKGLLQDILYAENTEGRILDGAKQAIVKAKENNKYDPRWKDAKVKLTLGGQFTEITVEDAMSLYALSKRPQALQHLLSDGIEIYSVNKDGDRELVKRRMLIDELRYLSETVLPDNAKSYVDEVVGYITKEIGSERNKITEALYGFKKYTEEYYFPIKVSSNERDANSVRSEELSALKNGSATKSVSENAKQAIVVDGFSDTVYNHIYTSAMYCAYVLPIENFTKVLNYRYNPNYGEIYGDVLQGGKIATKWDIQTDIKTKMGTNYFSSIMDLVRDVNSGNISPQKLVLMNKFITNMKKASTMANISVVVQQPMAVVRAFMYVEPKYFGKTTKADMDEMYANNGAALKKDIGYFDVNMGRSVTDWLDGDYTPSEDLQMTFKERVKSGEIKDTINELAGWGANKADEITWVAIWKACRNKVKAENGNLSEADQMAKASKLFSNVVGFTQVYDSVFSKCSHMRNKDSAAQMLMSFKAEPITTLNMIAQASHDYITNKNNYTKKRFFTALTCFVGSMVATNLTKAMWGAFRDDDDEYSWLEKVIAKLSGGVIGDVFGLLPYLGDIYNVMQGYDITRMDTNWISTLQGVVNQATKEDVDGTKLINKILELLSQLSGYPIYAAKRDATTIIRTGKNVISDVIGYRDMPTTTADGMIEALQDEFSFLN